MRVKVEMEGLSQLARQFASLGDDARETMMAVITDVVTDTHASAVQGIQRGPKSGRVYRRGNVTHQASAPGQYPASDTGRLASNVEFRLPTLENLTGLVGTNIEYGPHLEFGTSRMAARPWLLPSFEKAKIGVSRELRAEFERRAGR